MTSLPGSILNSDVKGLNLKPGDFQDQLRTSASLLVFLRHLNCIFCRESVSDLREIASRKPAFLPVLFFFREDVSQGRRFFQRFWPEAKAISDPEGRFYDAVGVPDGNLVQLVGPNVIFGGIRALMRGHLPSRPSGNIRVLAKMVVEKNRTIVWQHEYRDAADHPDYSQIPLLGRVEPAEAAL